MDTSTPRARPVLDQDATLRVLLESTRSATGEEFFKTLVRNLSAVLGTLGA